MSRESIRIFFIPLFLLLVVFPVIALVINLDLDGVGATMADPFFWDCVKNTVLAALGAAALAILVAIGFAYHHLYHRDSMVYKIANLFNDLPIALPHTVAGLALLMAFGRKTTGFLGETGAGISETVGIGTPKKVAAVEVWLFDKNDIRTVTKVLMSEHAYRDDAMRSKLASKGEAVLAQPGVPVVLETQTLRVVATIRNLKYGADPTPAPNSYFENLTLDIAAYAKEGATSAPGTAIGDRYGAL